MACRIVVFVHRLRGSCLVTSPLCGQIATFEFYFRKYQSKIVWNRLGATGGAQVSQMSPICLQDSPQRLSQSRCCKSTTRKRRDKNDQDRNDEGTNDEDGNGEDKNDEHSNDEDQNDEDKTDDDEYDDMMPTR